MRKFERTRLVTPAVLFFLFFSASTVAGQAELPQELTLEEAIRIALQTSPLLQADLNNRDVSDWNVKASYASLIPSASVGSGLSWQGSGEQQFGSVTLGDLGFTDQPSYYFSSYNLGISYTLNGQVLLALPQAKADREAQIAQGMASGTQTAFQVTQAYLEVLRQEEGLKVAQRELERARGNLRLARGQREVGSGTPMDERQAEVAVGRARVNVLTGENGVRIAKFRLLQQMGLDPREGFTLTSTFELLEPDWTEEELTNTALERNPQMVGLRASIRTQEYSTRMARSAYLPTVSFSAGLSGFTREASDPGLLVAQSLDASRNRITQCQALNELYRRLADPLPAQDCSAYLFTEADRRALVNQNDNFPFSFTRNPPSASLMISLPLFQGLRRQRDVEAARIAEEDTRLQLRDQELRLKADLASGLSTLRTAYEAALIEEENQIWADEQLRLAQERYQLGAATFLELGEAETVKAQADRDLIAAIFAYHDALASLEALVGTSLRVR
ncbi:MAG: TolC family protein [Longimicrobiales bacterium]